MIVQNSYHRPMVPHPARHRDGFLLTHPRCCNYMGRQAALLLAGLTLLGLLVLPPLGSAQAMEMCSAEAKGLMRKAGIREDKIEAVCKLAARSQAPLAISLRRREPELGYCLVTLALRNDSIQYLNRLSLTSADGRFDIFKFHNIPPGSTGYAAARSRILLACDELGEIGISFRWPATVRIGDKSPQGKRLERYKPLLLNKLMRWNR